MPQHTQAKSGEHSENTKTSAGAGLLADAGGGTEPLLMMDRSAPGWAKPLSWFFSLGTATSILGACVLTVFFLDLAAREQEPIMALILACVGLIPVAGVLIFEFSHTKALAGYRIFRNRNSAVAHAVIAAGMFLMLEFVHPLLGLAIPFGAVLSLSIIKLVKSLGNREPMWDFLPQEAISILSGRDEIGRKLALLKPENHGLLRGFLQASVWLSLLLAFALSSWLAAREVVSITAIPAVALITFWSITAVNRYLIQRSHDDPLTEGLAQSVTRLKPTVELEPEDHCGGLRVEGLSVSSPTSSPLLADIKFDLGPGQVLGIQGPAGSGKTLLLRTLVGPHDLTGLDVRGCVRQGDSDLWERSTNPSSVPALIFPPVPLILPTSGANNLSFFQRGSALERGKRILEQLVFATDAVERICAAPDATRLSGSEQKSLAFARGFLLSPALYLLDRPEDAISEKTLGALAARLRQECRAGRSFVLVTENRALLDICDKLLVLQDGRVIDFGPAQEIRQRQSSGWQRFVGTRSLETEENLEAWVRSHFLREGDEANRRTACMVVAEMLAFSCQNVAPLSHQSITFEFKHFEGHCLIKMVDRDIPISSGLLKRAQNDAENHDGTSRLSPLAAIYKACETVDTTVELDLRVMQVKISTYDPRKSGNKPPAHHENAGNIGGAAHHANKP